jgi:ribonuclease PH
MRPSKRHADELRKVFLEVGYLKHAVGSCLIRMGDTHVICSATIEEKPPVFLRGSGTGWITAEYGMLPCATHQRTDREAAKGKQSGRTQEIQRLIGRALRSVVKLDSFGERQIRVDCDVLSADGGTRTAAITASYIALYAAFHKMLQRGQIKAMPMKDHVAAVSCGIYQGQAVLDLDYAEDSQAEVDANFVMTGAGLLVEVQATAEKEPFEEGELTAMLELARQGIDQLVMAQKRSLASLTSSHG